MINQKGQTLLEVLLALVIASLVLGGIILVTSMSLSNTQYSKNQNLAAFYAKEGLSEMRQKKNSDWCSFEAITGAPITENLPTTSDGVDFVRETDFDTSSPDCSNEVKVEVKVSWTDNKCSSGSPLCHSVELVSCLLNIDEIVCP